jgi:hypothetical protein
VKGVTLVAVLTLALPAGASAGSDRTLRGHGLELSLPAGWHGLAGPAGMQVADLPLPRRARSSAGVVRVPRGHVHLIVSNGGPWVPYLPAFRSARAPLTLRKRDLLPGGMEGFAGNDTFARRDARLGGSMVDVLADLGPRPRLTSALRKANAALATLRVLPPRVLRPRQGRLAADGISARLLRGWSGRIEIPAQHYGSRLVLRAARGDVHVDLLELTELEPGHVNLPIVLRPRDVLQHSSPPLARRVFSTDGRSFDLSVTAPSAGDLREANRLLATLEVAPRAWTFRSCDLSLRLPGTWHVAVRPRNGCYPLLKLHGPRVLVLLTDLRPGERATGRVLRRAGRRFRVEVTPAAAHMRANEVLATLRAWRRS